MGIEEEGKEEKKKCWCEITVELIICYISVWVRNKGRRELI